MKETPARVALVIGQLSHGGSERQLFELATRLPHEGFSPVVICMSQSLEPYGSALQAAGVEVIALPRHHRWEWGRIARLAKVMRREAVVLVHSFLFSANAYAGLANWLTPGRRFLPSVRNREDTTRGGTVRWLDRAILRRGDLVLVNSESLGRWVEEFYGCSADRLRVVPNGLDLSRFEAIAPLAVEGAAEITIGSVSVFKEQKRIPFLLEVCRRLLSRRPEIHVRLVGGGPLVDEMIRRRDEMGLSESVAIPGPSTAVAEELAGFRVFLLGSDREGMPNAILEAMAAARPVVATRVTGTEDLVEDGVTGYLVAPEDLDGFVRAVDSLIDDPPTARRMGVAARARANHYAVDKMVSRTAAVYREILNGGSSAVRS